MNRIQSKNHRIGIYGINKTYILIMELMRSLLVMWVDDNLLNIRTTFLPSYKINDYKSNQKNFLLNFLISWINGKDWKQWRKNYLIVDDYILDKVLVDIAKFDDTKILIDTDDKLPYNITLENVVILITSVIKDGDKIYWYLYLEGAFYDE